MNELTVCPGTLKSGYDTYSPACRKRLFGGKKVNHILPYDVPSQDERIAVKFLDNRKRLSISGVQEKLGLVLDGHSLRLNEPEERGQYLLKPIPRDLKNVNEVPANEHLTMQIARQVYGMEVAENGLIFFKNGQPAYLTKRFDVTDKGSKWGVEDFAGLAGATSAIGGSNFKYDYSYEAMGTLLRRYVPAWKIEIEKFFRLVLFNYLFSNGDAHLKNFSLIQTQRGDYRLSPAYDLINTRLHVDDSDFALSRGLFEEPKRGYKSSFSGKPTSADFIDFGELIGVSPKRIGKIISPYLEKQPKLELLVNNSFLGDKSQRAYLLHYATKLNTLR